MPNYSKGAAMILEKSAKCLACKLCLGYVWKDREEIPHYINCKLEKKKEVEVLKGHKCANFEQGKSLFEAYHKKKNGSNKK